MAQEIARLRKRMGLTLEQFAERLAKIRVARIADRLGDIRSLTAAQIWQWEAGIRMPGPLIQAAIQELQEQAVKNSEID